jgi:hypothetical protein
VFLGVCACLPLIAIVGVAGLLLFACLRQPAWRMGALGTLGLLIPLLIVVWKLDRGWRGVGCRDMCLLAVGAATFVIVHIGMAGPIMYSLERTGPFVRQVEAMREKAPGTVTFFRVNPDAEAVKFMANLSQPLEPQFAGSIETLRDMPGTHYVIAREAVFRSLPVDESRPMRVLVRGRIGHKDFVAFTWDGTQ